MRTCLDKIHDINTTKIKCYPKEVCQGSPQKACGNKCQRGANLHNNAINLHHHDLNVHNNKNLIK